MHGTTVKTKISVKFPLQ